MSPLFIGGAGRSGTTLLASMLGAAAGTIVTPESQFKTDVGHRYPSGPDFDAGSALAAVESSWRFKIWDLTLNDHDRAAARRQASWPDLLRWLVQHYATAHGRQPAALWIDHTPENIRFVPLLARWFPDARFVHLIRDGRALLASGKKLDWKKPGVAASARWWGFIAGLGLAAEQYLPAERIMRVHYETLIEEPEATLQRLSAWLDLAYTPVMLQSDGFAVPSYTQGQHGRVGKPPDPSRLQAWQEELDPREIEIFEAASFELLEMLGYQPLYGIAAQPSTFAEQMLDLVQATGRRVGVQRRLRRARVSWRRPSGQT